MKLDYNMKFHIKEKMSKMPYLETIDMKPPVEHVKIKDALKKVKPTPTYSSTKRSPSFFEHVDSFYSYSAILYS